MTASEAVTRPRKLKPEVRRSLAAVKAGTANETELQRVVMAYAKDHGWMVHHATRARVKDGKWMTPVWGHPGYPDLSMTRGGRLVIAEVKTKAGTVSAEQWSWLNRLGEVDGIEVVVWRPEHWNRRVIQATLR